MEEAELPSLPYQRTLRLPLLWLGMSGDRICLQVTRRCALAQSTGAGAC